MVHLPISLLTLITSSFFYLSESKDGKSLIIKYLKQDYANTYTYILSIFLDFGYTLVTRGNSCARITNKRECERSARALGLPDTTAVQFRDSRYPPFCYYKTVTEGPNRRKGLKFNTAADSSMSCHPLRQCLCQNDSSK